MRAQKVPQLGYWLSAPGGDYHMLPHWANNPTDLSVLVDRARSDPSIPAVSFFLRVEYYEGSPDFFSLELTGISLKGRLGSTVALDRASTGLDYDP